MQVAALLLKMLLPDLFNMQVGFILHAGPIKVALGIFMQQQVFQPSHAGVQQSAVLGHMLFFDHADLLVQPAAKVTVIKGADVHIIVAAFSLVMGAAVAALMGLRTLSRGWRCSAMVGRPGMISV